MSNFYFLLPPLESVYKIIVHYSLIRHEFMFCFLGRDISQSKTKHILSNKNVTKPRHLDMLYIFILLKD